MLFSFCAIITQEKIKDLEMKNAILNLRVTEVHNVAQSSREDIIRLRWEYFLVSRVVNFTGHLLCPCPIRHCLLQDITISVRYCARISSCFARIYVFCDVSIYGFCCTWGFTGCKQIFTLPTISLVPVHFLSSAEKMNIMHRHVV